jgi:hypothetical protein
LLREQSLDRIADAARPLMEALKKLPPFAWHRAHRSPT